MFLTFTQDFMVFKYLFLARIINISQSFCVNRALLPVMILWELREVKGAGTQKDPHYVYGCNALFVTSCNAGLAPAGR